MSSRQEPHVAQGQLWEKVCVHLKVHSCIPFLCCPTLILLQAMRQAVAEIVEELKMKPTMMNLVEA